MSHDELPKILSGIERHMAAVKDILASGTTLGLSRVVWELGTMCSLGGKALKDMSLEMERMEQKPEPAAPPPPKRKAADDQPGLF